MVIAALTTGLVVTRKKHCFVQVGAPPSKAGQMKGSIWERERHAGR